MEKYAFLMLISGLSLFACQKQEPTPQPAPQFTMRLKKVIRHTQLYNGEKLFVSEYFYNASGKIDSLVNIGSRYKVVYDPSGRIAQLQYVRPGNYVGAIDSYEYDASGRVIRIESKTVNTLSGEFEGGWYTTFDYNLIGQMERKRFYTVSGELTRTVTYTFDNQGNIIEERHFLPMDDGVCSCLIKNTHNEGWNPHFAAGLSAVLPGAYALHTSIHQEAHYGGCGDYTGPTSSVFEFNAENLPVIETVSNGDRVEYFYE